MDAELDKGTCDAIDGDTTSVVHLWRAIAEGKAADGDVLAWAQHVAQQIVAKVINAEDIDGANRRAEEALKAIGLRGRANKNAELDEVVDVFDSFDDDDGPLTRAKAVEKLRDLGQLQDVSAKNAQKALDRARQRLRNGHGPKGPDDTG